MKCGACGYERWYGTYTVDEVVRYKSGKNKGEIKEVKEKEIDPYENDPEFIELEFEKEVDRVGTRERRFCGWDFDEVRLFVCPVCATVRVGDLDIL